MDNTFGYGDTMGDLARVEVTPENQPATDNPPPTDAPAAAEAEVAAASADPETAAVEPEPEPTFPERELEQGLLRSALGRVGLTANGLTMACLDLSLSNQELTSIALVSGLVHLQNIDLSYNHIVDAQTQHLDNLPYLVDINLSHNSLRSVPALAASRFVQSIDLAANQITAINFAPHVKFLKTLTIDDNSLTTLGGLNNLQCLHDLSACRNAISTTAGLASLPHPASLQRLALSANTLTEATALEALTSLVYLDLTENQLGSVKGIEDHPVLLDIYLKNNSIDGDLDAQIDLLQTLPQLRTLQLTDNPVAKIERYRHRILYRLPSLLFCDDVEVSAEEKIAAQNSHGEDTDSRAGVREKHFPDGNPMQVPLYANETLPSPPPIN